MTGNKGERLWESFGPVYLIVLNLLHCHLCDPQFTGPACTGSGDSSKTWHVSWHAQRLSTAKSLSHCNINASCTMWQCCGHYLLWAHLNHIFFTLKIFYTHYTLSHPLSGRQSWLKRLEKWLVLLFIWGGKVKGSLCLQWSCSHVMLSDHI